MKKWFILIGILVALFITGYFILTSYAVKLVQPHLQKAMGPGLTLAEIKMKTTYLSARGIRYEDPRSKQRFLQVEEMRIYPSLLSLLKKSLHIKEFTILRPSLFFYRSREGVFVGPWVTVKREREGKEVSGGEEKKRGERTSIRIDRIRIREGSVDFVDRKVGEPPARIQLRELDFEIRDIQYPLASSHSAIGLEAKTKGGMREGTIDAKGWIDPKTSDTETSLKIRDIEVKTFEPYYRKRISAEIESGYTNVDAKISIRQKMIDATGQLELNDLHIKGAGNVLYIPTETLVSLLKEKGNSIKVQFQVKGNLDDPKFNLQETFLTRIALSFAEALGIPIKVVGGTIIDGTVKTTEGLIEGLKSIEDMFWKKKEKKR